MYSSAFCFIEAIVGFSSRQVFFFFYAFSLLSFFLEFSSERRTNYTYTYYSIGFILYLIEFSFYFVNDVFILYLKIKVALLQVVPICRVTSEYYVNFGYSLSAKKFLGFQKNLNYLQLCKFVLLKKHGALFMDL